MPGVCGVGIERDDHGDYVLAIHVDANRAEAVASLPPTLEGYPLKIVRSGPFKAQTEGFGTSPDYGKAKAT
jgi:hypothetical protein